MRIAVSRTFFYMVWVLSLHFLGLGISEVQAEAQTEVRFDVEALLGEVQEVSKSLSASWWQADLPWEQKVELLGILHDNVDADRNSRVGLDEVIRRFCYATKSVRRLEGDGLVELVRLSFLDPQGIEGAVRDYGLLLNGIRRGDGPEALELYRLKVNYREPAASVLQFYREGHRALSVSDAGTLAFTETVLRDRALGVSGAMLKVEYAQKRMKWARTEDAIEATAVAVRRRQPILDVVARYNASLRFAYGSAREKLNLVEASYGVSEGMEDVARRYKTAYAGMRGRDTEMTVAMVVSTAEMGRPIEEAVEVQRKIYAANWGTPEDGRALLSFVFRGEQSVEEILRRFDVAYRVAKRRNGIAVDLVGLSVIGGESIETIAEEFEGFSTRVKWGTWEQAMKVFYGARLASWDRRSVRFAALRKTEPGYYVGVLAKRKRAADAQNDAVNTVIIFQ